MKYFSFIAVALCAAMFVSCNNNGGQQPVAGQATPSNANVAQQAPAQQAPAQDLPQAAPQATPQAGMPAAVTDFINKNFPGATITGQDPDNDGELEIYLSDGTKVEFAPNNEWKTVKCPGKGVPAALVPQAIANYVKTNFQSALITKIDKKYGSYEIELNNGVELHFAADGSFIGYDD
ncbi:MAG: PepSY-like domain-containing protein [Muribaculaceae bacterium]|nr:PepSY-like domain-containing protein [Muribaculaceae bacterium]